MFYVGRFREGVGIGGAIKSLTAPLRVWGDKQVQRIKGAFQVGGHHRHGGSAWVPGKKTVGTLMVQSGRLRESISHSEGARTARIFTTVSYARNHQSGIGVPKREVIVITRSDAEELEAELKKAIEGMINGAN